MLVDVVCLVPLMERFEKEWGTLVSLAMFLGPLATIPAGLYMFLDMVVFRQNTPVMGAR